MGDIFQKSKRFADIICVWSLREALSFIDEREMFWKQHDARQPTGKSIRIVGNE